MKYLIPTLLYYIEVFNTYTKVLAYIEVFNTYIHLKYLIFTL